MALIKWNGNNFPQLSDFFNADDFFNNSALETLRNATVSVPAANITENEKEFKIDLAAPGLEKKDFNIEVDSNGILSISAEKESKKHEEKENYARREFSYSAFSRSFQLPENVKADHIKGTYEDGILQIAIPKKEEAKKNSKKVVPVQ